MKTLLIIIFILIFILLIPFPIKINYSYIDNKFNISIYSFKIKLKRKNKVPEKNEVKEEKKTKLLDLIKMLDKNKLKFTLFFDFKMDMGVDDAANTAILYGLIYAFSPILQRLLNILFKIKRFNFFVNPNFESLTLKIKGRCIIISNLAKIIYMAIILIRFFKRSKKESNNKNLSAKI